MVRVLVVKMDERTSSPLCFWDVPSDPAFEFVEVGDEWWSATFGSVQLELLDIKNQCFVELDFSRVEWIDPLPLLSLLVSVKGFCVRSGSLLRIQLGVGFERNARRRGFLKFLGQHDFLGSLEDLPHVIVSLGNEEHRINGDSKIWEKIDYDHLTYPESRCLNAKVIAIDSIAETGDRGVSGIVRLWLDEIRDYGLKRFEHDAEYVDDLLHKIRVLLTENVLNAVEHAYYRDDHARNSRFFGLYARIRREASLKKEQRGLTEAIVRENSRCPALSLFLRDCHCSWVEIFYYDEGRGLLADIDAWSTNGGDGLRRMLAKIKPSTNVLHYISRHIFQDAISRHDRKEKTVLTGLQHTGLVLADGHDYARAYSSGEWVGATHPWSKNVQGKEINLKKLNEYAQKEPSRGTAWHYCVRLCASQTPTFSEWPGDRIDKSDVEPIPQSAARTDLNDWQIFDERDLGTGINYLVWHDQPLSGSRSLWLPGAVTKQHVYQWLKKLNSIDCDRSLTWIIADLSKEQARTLCAVLKSERSGGKPFPTIVIYIVTSDWHHLYLKTNTARTGFMEKTKIHCRDIAKKYGGNIFRLLRAYDSKLFWTGVVDENIDANRPSDSPFIHEPVIWDRDDQKVPRVVLRGYLDLTHALVDTRRTSVAARALRRVWHLFARDAECVASDALLTNLLPREARRSRGDGSIVLADNEARPVVVNSVLVTGATAERHAQEDREAIHLLRHSQFVRGESYIPASIKNSDRYALNWLEQEVVIADPCGDSLPYERIPGTPYIGRGGPKAIPVRRFERKDEMVGCFEKSIYPQNPQETYDHFLHLGLLKIGHWVYGSHHDLLTINLGLAIDRESIDFGPILKWICTELAHQKTLGAELVIYPSHPVTEKLVQAIKKNSSRGNYDTQDNFVPVHFLGSHTQTSIRIPSLTYDRIKTFLEAWRESHPGENCRVVLLDDGSLTGKVQRELEQLLRNAGAEKVVHVGLVARTGLPLYRQYLVKEYRELNRFYWRWDVPPLGRARTCPLCRAIHQARELVGTLWSNEARDAVCKWADTWMEQPVGTKWWHSGLAPAQLPAPRELTFGKEWLKPEGKVINYRIKHATTTGLAASVIELIRTTSYKDVGIKVARCPWKEEEKLQGSATAWRRASLEILTSQTLLFFDDFDQDELVARFVLILELLSSSDDSDNTQVIDLLACLVLLLATGKQAKEVVQRAIPKLILMPKGNLEFQISLGLLIHRANINDKQILKWAGCERKLTAHAKFSLESLISAARTLAQKNEVRGTAHGLQMLIMLLGESDITAHAGFLRQRLTGEIEGGRVGVVRDLRTIVQALKEIDPLVCDAYTTEWSRDVCIREIERLMEILSLSEGDTSDELGANTISQLTSDISSFSLKFRKTFLKPVDEMPSYLQSAVTQEVFGKILLNRDGATKKRWHFDEVQNTFVLPSIVSIADESMFGKKNVVVFPPVARQMVLDSLLDVIHSSEPYPDGTDMICHLSIDGDMMNIAMRNNACSGERISEVKASEAIFSQHIYSNPITRSFDEANCEMIVNVSLPLLTSLGRRA